MSCSVNPAFVVLVLLDLIAAFDTVDHEILLCHLNQLVGIQGAALGWFKSYLVDRTSCVNILASIIMWSPAGLRSRTTAFSLHLLPCVPF